MTTDQRPQDFDAFWNTVDSELAALPVAPELAAMPQHSADSAAMYGARFTSIGPYRLFAYTSVPNDGGPHPALVHMGGYGSVVHVPAYEERQRYVAMTLRHRGQRSSDQPFAAAYPGLLTHGIETPQGYIYRGIVADCCRAVDFLMQQPGVDGERITLMGNDLALLAAALRPQVAAVVYSPGPFFAARRLAQASDAYPLEELNDFARFYPDRAEDMWRTLDYFDPMHMADRVRAATLLISGNPDLTAPLAQAIGGSVEVYQAASSGYKDGVKQEAWLRARFGYTEALLPAQWRGDD